MSPCGFIRNLSLNEMFEHALSVNGSDNPGRLYNTYLSRKFGVRPEFLLGIGEIIVKTIVE